MALVLGITTSDETAGNESCRTLPPLPAVPAYSATDSTAPKPAGAQALPKTSPSQPRHDIQYYSEHLRGLAHSQIEKSEKFLENGCLEYDKDSKTWKVNPIEGYNKTIHEISKENGAFVCSCQGCQTRLKKGLNPNCSHIGALYMFFERRNRAHGFGPYRQLALNEEMAKL